MSKINKTDLENSVKKCIQYIDTNVVTLRLFCNIVENDLNIENVIFQNKNIKKYFKKYTLQYIDINDITNFMNNMTLDDDDDDDISNFMNNMTL